MAQIYRHAEWRKCNHISKAFGHKGVATNSAAQNCPAPFPPTDFGTAPDSNFNLQVGQVVCQAPLAAQLWPGGFAHRQSYYNLNKARNGRMVGGICNWEPGTGFQLRLPNVSERFRRIRRRRRRQLALLAFASQKSISNGFYSLAHICGLTNETPKPKPTSSTSTSTEVPPT